MCTLKSGVSEPGWRDDATQALLLSRKKVVQLPGCAPRGPASSQCDPPSVVRRIRFVPEPAAHPVLALIMRSETGGSSGYGAFDVGVGVGLMFGEANGVAVGVTPTDCRARWTTIPSPMASTRMAAAATTWSVQPVFRRGAAPMMRSSMPAGGGVLAPRWR